MDSYRHLKGESELCDYKYTNSGGLKKAIVILQETFVYYWKNTKHKNTERSHS